MSALVTVRNPYPLDKVQRFEQEHPEVMEPIIAAARKYMTSHRRVERAGEVMDLDEYATEEDYQLFLAEAGDAIRAYSELLGGGVHDVVWTTVSEPPPGD